MTTTHNPKWDRAVAEARAIERPSSVQIVGQMPRSRKPKKVVRHEGQKICAKIDGTYHKQTPELARAMAVKTAGGYRYNIFVTGPKGWGKSTANVQIAKAMNLNYAYIGQTIMPIDITGYVNQASGVFKPTPFTQTFEEGGVLVLEEMDSWSPQATLAVNVPLAGGYMVLDDGRTIQRHPDCIIVACANTWGTGATTEYVGRNKLDDAFLDRFPIKVAWGEDLDLERRVANDDLVCDLMIHARGKADEYGLRVNSLSPRTTYAMADMCRAGYKLWEAANASLLAGLDRDTRARLVEGYDLL